MVQKKNSDSNDTITTIMVRRPPFPPASRSRALFPVAPLRSHAQFIITISYHEAARMTTDMGHCHHFLLHTVDHLSRCAVILHLRHATCFLWLCWMSSHLHLHLHDQNQSILISFFNLHFQDEARLIVRFAFLYPMTQSRWCQLLYLYQHHVRMSDCMQDIEPCKCKGKGHWFQRLGY